MSDDATSAAIPKNAPCGSAARNRAISTVSKVGASADATVPMVKATTSTRSNDLRGKRDDRAAIVGAPTTTPAA